MISFTTAKAPPRTRYLFARVIVTLRCLSSTGNVVGVDGLNVAVITGTTRTEGPPRPILGPRVSSMVVKALENRGNTVTVIDPLNEDFNLPLLNKPEFAYARNRVPDKLKSMQQILASSDAYVCITPEYNHAPSPSLLNILNHFGSSTFSFKPSAIVSYSAGQWGGTRAAIALRPILSELGCLPVSAMIHIPKPQEFLDDDGCVQEKSEREHWNNYLDRCFAQLEWWSSAAKIQREKVDPFTSSPAFRSNPSQRNSP
mmetsp:Transcript_38991/g.80962  ORF Transcript_38991/g.80962 Transcript_38991/m.80962 type:complete len:257 (+) Transcript_38991:75-845(+)